MVEEGEVRNVVSQNYTKLFPTTSKWSLAENKVYQKGTGEEQAGRQTDRQIES